MSTKSLLTAALACGQEKEDEITGHHVERSGNNAMGPDEDKTAEMEGWIRGLKKLVDKGVKTYAFFNNHYAGCAPGSATQFEVWQKSICR